MAWTMNRMSVRVAYYQDEVSWLVVMWSLGRVWNIFPGSIKCFTYASEQSQASLVTDSPQYYMNLKLKVEYLFIKLRKGEW